MTLTLTLNLTELTLDLVFTLTELTLSRSRSAGDHFRPAQPHDDPHGHHRQQDDARRPRLLRGSLPTLYLTYTLPIYLTLPILQDD